MTAFPVRVRNPGLARYYGGLWSEMRRSLRVVT